MSGIKSSSEFPRRAVRVALGLTLVFPYLIWIARLPSWTLPEGAAWWPHVAAAAVQATLSALFSLVIGFALFLGQQAWRRPRAAEAWLLIPNLVPPIFVGLALVRAFTLLTATPYGLTAVVVAHVLLNAGLVAVAFDRLVSSRLAGQAEVADVLGSARVAFWREVAFPQMRAELAQVFLFVFALSFTSFSLPLMLGGARATTLEVAIYDLIRVEGRWDAAVLLALLQTAALLALALLLPRAFYPRRASRGRLRLFACRPLAPFVPLPAFVLLAGAIRFVPLDGGVREALPAAVLATLALGLAVGALHLLAFLAVAFASPHVRLDRFLSGYLAPSPAITGFGLLLLPTGGNGVKLAFALTLFSFPLLYRWLVQAELAGLESQIAVARTLGAGWGPVLFEIVWPQTARAILGACGLAAVWAGGDFALSGILLDHEQRTVPLLIQELLGQYRLDQAATLLLPLLASCLIVYFFFRGARRYVTR